MEQLLLGNLTVNQMIKQLGINITNEEKELLENMRCDNANSIPENKFHCFDMPFVIHAGSKSVGSKLYDILSKYQNDMVCSIRVDIIKQNDGENND